jgi:hypothetical protein
MCGYTKEEIEKCHDVSTWRKKKNVCWQVDSKPEYLIM